jgi:hypothetical protein
MQQKLVDGEKRAIGPHRRGRWKEEAKIGEWRKVVKNFVLTEINTMEIAGLGYAY